MAKRRREAKLKVVKGGKAQREKDRQRWKRAESDMSALVGRRYADLKPEEKDLFHRAVLIALGFLDADGVVIL